jgi:Caspase domain
VLVTAVDASGDRRQEARVLVRDGAGHVAAGPRPPGARLGAGLPGPLARPGPSDRPVLDRPAPDRPLPEQLPSERPQPAPVAAAPPAPAPSVAPAAAPSPLTIALSAPADRARVEQDATVLAGIVSGSKGVARIVVTLNGTEVSRQEDKAPRPAVALNVPLKLAEGSNTIVVTAADVDGRLSQELRSVQFDKLTPLTVAFRYPEDRARVTEATSVVAALLTSSKGVASAKVLLNGAEVWTQTERTPPTSMAVAVPVSLRPGANAIVLTAAETDGTVRQELRTIVYEPPAVVAATPPAASAPPVSAHDRWAVVIGVSNYESAAIPRLRYTVPDAEALYQALVGVGGFKKDNVLLLTDRAERKPTLRNIKWALGTFLSRSAKKDDTVVIFFAGHGAPDVDTRGIERDGLAKYLIPSDADPDDLYSTALPMDELQTIFGRIEAERVVAFLDACYSGAAKGGRTFSSKLTRAGNIDDLFLERLTRSKGRAIVTASRTNEVSLELPELGHGIFSYYLVNGLKGAADLNRDGIVSLQELYEYVEQQVSAKSRSVGGNQHPVMKGELEGALPLVKVRGK